MSASHHRLTPTSYYETGAAPGAIELSHPVCYDRVSGATARPAVFPDVRIGQILNLHTPRSSRWLIYVVDECPGLAEVARAILESEGFTVRAFSDRVRAWRSFVFADPRPVLLVTDDLGGELPGIELIRRCRDIDPNLKTLWVSHRDPSILTGRERALLDGYQSRPYCNPLLVYAVWRLCGPPSGLEHG